MGLIIKGTIPRVTPFSLWPLVSVTWEATQEIFSFVFFVNLASKTQRKHGILGENLQNPSKSIQIHSNPSNITITSQRTTLLFCFFVLGFIYLFRMKITRTMTFTTFTSSETTAPPVQRLRSQHPRVSPASKTTQDLMQIWTKTRQTKQLPTVILLQLTKNMLRVHYCQNSI